MPRVKGKTQILSKVGWAANEIERLRSELRIKGRENGQLRSENIQLRNRLAANEAFLAFHRSQGAFSGGSDHAVSGDPAGDDRERRRA